ncbi:hypothetical protein SUSAZ_09890 [Sulfolobus acidocaldarius SUSAZ]|nr:hypothetical protein SUSAZ_09890 [Sulfolobus acidocaldarius SUSAZ]
MAKMQKNYINYLSVSYVNMTTVNLAQSNQEIVELLVPVIIGYMSLFISSIYVYRIG